MLNISQLKKIFLDHLDANDFTSEPKTLYDPANYIVRLGGKRIRPVLSLAASEMFGGTPEEALAAAMAVELFHNFSLVHDDVMDNASLRRGKATVHSKWDLNTAILSGDVLLIEAYDQLLKYPDTTAMELLRIFVNTSREICIGQQLDIDFESKEDLLISEYIHMISLKTSVLLAASLQMGAIVAQANAHDQKHLYNFGKNLGIAFQVQDDLLDSFGDSEKVGKQIGGDILQNKKTYLYLKTLELAEDKDKKKLKHFFTPNNGVSSKEKIEQVLSLFKNYHVDVYAHELKNSYKDLATSHLNALKVDEEKKQTMHELIQFLNSRTE